MGQEAVDSSHPHVAQEFYLVAKNLGRDPRLLRHRKVGRARAHDEHWRLGGSWLLAAPGGDGTREGVNTQRYHESEIDRITRVAFEMARKRGGRVTSAEKSNVMESGLLWREIVTRVHSEYQDVELSHMLADNCAMQLVKEPKQFDVIVTDNLFGDLLSDEAAMLTGSLGMLPSASLGDGGPGLYEPIHGSAPDITGLGIANPIATILSLAMALRYSLNMIEEADLIEQAVGNTLDGGYRSADIWSEGMTKVSTVEMGDAVLSALDALKNKN